MGTRYGVDLDGDVEMSTPQPVYEFTKRPDGPSFEGVVATLKGSVEPAVLETLATYVLEKRVEEVQDAEILGEEQKRCGSLKKAFILDISTLFRKALKMDKQVEDCDARVFQYFLSFTKIVEDNNLQALIGSGNVTSPDYKD
ncbi:unnamed protein product [Phytophthora fragariaefolia]|uniref:Unnamed protein product n=1 Tax=Phytophthora fragariaefolia TaxID=1490495 RepID=A0A9W7CXB3_9STRA|nr:unnamed protein product [Phytophthora fragariaefolia]